MNNQWLSFQNFVQNQQLLEAINTLSIHTKLKLGGDDDEGRDNDVTKAKDKLTHFIQSFDKLLRQTDGEQPLPGADYRLRQLVQDFYSAKNNNLKFHSQLFTESPSQVLRLIKSEKIEDKKALIECLTELRTLIEEHLHTDTDAILGEF
jgi:hypothetical protein